MVGALRLTHQTKLLLNQGKVYLIITFSIVWIEEQG